MRLFFIPLERELIKKHKSQLEIASEYWIHINFFFIYKWAKFVNDSYNLITKTDRKPQ